MKKDGKEERFDMNNYGADGSIIHDYYALQKFMGDGESCIAAN